MPNATQIAKIFDSIIRYIVLLLAVCTPIFVIPASWASAAQSKALLIALALAIGMVMWFSKVILEKKLYFTFDPILLAIFLLPCTYMISALLSGNPSSMISGDALPGSVANMVMLFGVAALSAVVAQSRRRAAITVLFGIILSSAMVSVFQIARIAFPGLLDLSGALHGVTSTVVGSWHDLGIFLGLGMLLSVALLETSFAQETWKSVFLWTFAGISSALLLLVSFADTWLVVAGAGFLFASLRFVRAYRKSQGLFFATRYCMYWITFAVIALLLGLFGSYVTAKLPTRLQLGQIEVRPSWQGTFTVSQHTLGDGKTFVFGTGPNTFDQGWARFKPKEVNSTNFWNVDFQYGIGVVPTALVTVGIIGTLAWVLLVIALLWTGLGTYRAEPDPLRGLLFVSAMFLMAFHVFYVPGIGISALMFLMLGMLAGIQSRHWRIGELSFAPQSIFALIGILVLASSVVAASAMESRVVTSTLMVYKAGADYAKNGNLEQAISQVSSAIRVDPANDIAQRAAVEVGLIQFQDMVKTAPSDEQSRDVLQKALSGTISHGLAAISIDGANYQNWLALAGLYQSLAGIGIPGAYEQAQKAYLRAASTTPMNPLPYLQLGQLNLLQGKNDEARGYLSKAIDLKPNLPLPYYLRSQLEAARGNMTGAVQDAALAAQIANQDPVGWYNLGVMLYTANDFQNAGAALEKAVSLQNQYADAIFALGIVYEKLGMHDRAIAAMQNVLALNPNNTIVTKVLQNLSEGRDALSDLQDPAGAQALETPKQ